jgi:acyl-CoA synthetase (AMP-forming)/AMP-acid ligase II
VALVIYTSGTTGQPKGVLQTHGSVNAAISRFAARLGLGPGDRSIFASPLFWIHGCWHQALVPLHCGSGLVLDTRFDAARFLQTVVADRCTHLQGVPTQYEMILNHPESATYDLTGIRVAQIGGSTFHPSLLDRLRERAPNASFLAAYGLTEAGVVTSTAPDDSFKDIATTVGRMHPGGDAIVVDEDNDVPIEAGRVGELCLRSDCVMKGYLDDAEASSRALRGGWLHTGDLAVMEERGLIRILGRNQDAYKRGGITVYAADIETVLCEHPDVAAAAVVGVADRILGQVGVAFIVPAVGTTPDLEEVLSSVKGRLASYQVPKEIRVLDEFPRTGSGKIRKFELRASYEAKAGADVTPASATEPRR